MIKLLVLFVLLTLAFVSSAFAYTYTCEEGKFQIDAPEGWKTSEGVSTYYSEFGKFLSNFLSITNNYGVDSTGFIKITAIEDTQAVTHLKQLYLSAEGNATYLTHNEATTMNVEDGWTAGDHGYFATNNFLYELWYALEPSNAPDVESTIFKILNSFRALD